ncbi:MAG: GNAT family N-acetyltransferase [Thermoanaerobaculia bacterium]|nr:GNAT family N-acetyltransferase [Thermoanaerobaculia bacterium]
MLIRTAEKSELPTLRTLLEDSLEPKFDIRPVVEEKLFGSGYGGPARCRIALEEGAIRGVSVSCGSAIRLLAVAPAFRHRGIGSELLADAVSEIRLVGQRVTVGAAPGNYLVPGVPEENAESIEFLAKRGLVAKTSATDLTAELRDARRPTERSHVKIERVRSSTEELERFLEEEFGPAITWEIGHGLMTDRAVVRIARSEGAIIGFSACEINNAGLGTFGPQGVSESHRGRGIGAMLLHHSLADLREMGYEQARIPWVSSTKYYERACGAKVAGTYVVMRGDLRDPDNPAS